MPRTRDYVRTTGALCAVIAVLLASQGCQKATSVPPKSDSGKQTASAQEAASEKPKPQSASTSTNDPVDKTGKPSAGKPTAPKPSQGEALAPKPTPLPKTDIDLHDSRYADGKSPKLEADGKSVTVLYLPPHMSTIELTKGGQKKAYLTFGTITASGDKGNRLEIHVLARLSNPEDSKFEKVALIYSDKAGKGQSWTASAAGMKFKIEALDYGEWSDSPFPGTGMGWLKLRVTAK